ncbi:NAD(P)/FAD-dependent oxidoreductase [Niallia sp. Krafla_26]|uniref:NAD(P)/FAD-dependent oxidoreductase n=1 Tax=Niallia sp. Krafla_26 TaxID=3064703 RepID=UPI003D17EE23
MSKIYCIVGTGVAAVYGAKAIRDHDKEANIHVFGTEESLPYNRIKLSKDLYSDLRSEKVLIKKEKWYNDQNIKLHLQTKVTSIDTENQSILTASGESVQYNELLICTGAKNRMLTIDGVEKKGVFTIREMQEAEEFKAFVENKSHVVIIGGGVQGLETAWSIHKTGKKVTIVEVAPRLMARQLDEQTSSLLKDQLESAGVPVYVNTSVEEVIGGNEVEGVRTSQGTIPCDAVLYSIGVIPNLDIAIDTPIATNRGIIVNDQMETNVEHVYAAGDVTEWNGVVAGLWQPAMDQGKVAGKNMVSGSVGYQKTIPSTIFNAFDLSLFSIGLVDENQCDYTLLEEDGKQKYTRIFIKDQKIVGVISLEGVVASLPYKAAIENKVSLDGIDLNHVSVCEVMNELKERQKKSA